MKRIEIIANRAVEEDLMEAFHMADAARSFTSIPLAYGSGRSGRRLGNATWPEENFILVVYCEAEEAARIAEAVRQVKTRFPHEGIKLFEM